MVSLDVFIDSDYQRAGERGRAGGYYARKELYCEHRANIIRENAMNRQTTARDRAQLTLAGAIISADLHLTASSSARVAKRLSNGLTICVNTRFRE